MAVSQLRRITFGFTGNGFDAQLIDLPGRSRREHHPISQLCKEGKPEGVVLIHI